MNGTAETIWGTKTCDCGVDAMSVVGREADCRHPPPRPAVAQAEDPLSVLEDAAGVLAVLWGVEDLCGMAKVISPERDISITNAYICDPNVLPACEGKQTPGNPSS